MEPGNGWERWRGETDSRIGAVEDDVKALFGWRDQHERDVSALTRIFGDRLTRVETKVAGFAAAGAAAGAVFAVILEWFLGKLGG